MEAEAGRSRTRRSSRTQSIDDDDAEKSDKRQRNSSERETTPLRKSSRKSRGKSVESEESEDEPSVGKKETKGRKLDSIKELNESQHETPKKPDGKNADTETPSLLSEKKNEPSPNKEELPEKHKQQSDGSKVKPATDDLAGKQEESKKEKKEASTPLKLQRNEVKVPEANRKSRSR